MALRPVSDLGLVDLTDLAEPAKQEGAPTKPRTPKQRTQKPHTAKAPKPQAAKPPKAKAARNVARTGAALATWTVAGVCGVALGRAAVRR
jgi:hypothetical protein